MLVVLFDFKSKINLFSHNKFSNPLKSKKRNFDLNPKVVWLGSILNNFFNYVLMIGQHNNISQAGWVVTENVARECSSSLLLNGMGDILLLFFVT